MIITLGRQHGSNGHEIARELAKQLSIKCYDKEIVDVAAANSNFSKEVINSYDEKRVSAFIVPTPHYPGMNEGFRLNVQTTSAQFEAIRTLAQRESCIFVGRCADYVLRGRDDVVRVFIMGDMDSRIKCIMQRYSLNAEQARKLIKQVDKDRSSFYRYYTDQLWGESGNYDLCIDSSRIGVKGSVDIITTYIKSL